MYASTSRGRHLTPPRPSVCPPGLCGNWIEIAYGTSSGTVRVIVQHPETVGHGPQLFQTFAVHRSPVTKVSLSEKFLISACSEYHHVRSWSVTRFRGMISTQPGSQPLASFKIVSLESVDHQPSHAVGNDPGRWRRPGQAAIGRGDDMGGGRILNELSICRITDELR